ncbi:unnamed protein product, partial [Arabidopsis halleri]
AGRIVFVSLHCCPVVVVFLVGPCGSFWALGFVIRFIINGNLK